MGMNNKNKNYLIVKSVTGGMALVHIYKNEEAKKKSSIFNKFIVDVFNCGLELEKEKKGKEGKELIETCEKIIAKQSKEDKERHKPKKTKINGQWI